MYSLLLSIVKISLFWCFHYNKSKHLREEGESIRMKKLLNEALERKLVYTLLVLDACSYKNLSN